MPQQSANALSIPKIQHRIWFGSDLPEKYQEHLKKLAAKNPGNIIKLWTDSSILSSIEKNHLRDFCKKNNIQLMNIRAFPYLINYELIEYELDKAQTKSKNKRVHYAQASDLARISILIEQGGVYTDTDTESLDTLPILTPKFGLYVKECQGIDKTDQQDLPADDVSDIFYDFIAAHPQNSILKQAAEISALDYKTYHQSAHRRWEHSNNPCILQSGTIRLTGSALRFALEYAVSNRKIKPALRSDLFFADSQYFLSSYDRSWLDPNWYESTSEEHESVVHFRDEIEQIRMTHFPLNLDFMTKKFVKKVRESLVNLKKYAINDEVLRQFDDIELLLTTINTSSIESLNNNRQVDIAIKQQKLLEIIHHTTQLNDHCFEGYSKQYNFIRTIRNLLNTITSLFTGTKDNHNWFAEVMVNRRFFFLKPKSQEEANEISNELSSIEEESDNIKRCAFASK